MTPLLLLTLGLAAAPPPLLDQFGRASGLEQHRGKKVVALVVTARNLRALKGWEMDLRDRVQGLLFLRVVDVPEQPAVTWERVAEKLRARVPREVAIGIDLGRAWAAHFALDTAEVNVLVFDAAGRLAARFRGRRSKGLVKQVVDALERLPSPPAEAPS